MLLILLLLIVLYRFVSPSFSAPASSPQVFITAPAHNTQFEVGSNIIVQSTATDDAGIARVQLLVDQQPVRSDTPAPGKPQREFIVAQPWLALAPGAHLITVRATNQAGNIGEASMTLNVVALTTPLPTVTLMPPSPMVVPTATNAPVIVPTVPPSVNVAPATPQPTNTLPPPHHTTTFTEAEFDAVLHDILTRSQQNEVTAINAHLQNGQINTTIQFQVFGGLTIGGQITFGVAVANCDLQVSVVQSSLPLTLSEQQKADLSQTVKQTIKNELAKKTSYTCIDAVQIANGVMTIESH